MMRKNFSNQENPRHPGLSASYSFSTYQWIGLLTLLMALVTLPACAPSAGNAAPPPVTLTVFAAASLTEAFTALGPAFEAEHPDIQIVFNFAGSQQLAQQLGQGAPADLFASANQKQMEVAIQIGRVGTDAPRPFARNRLVVIYPADNPAGLTHLSDLTKPGLKLVLAAPQVPAGQYALNFLAKASQAAAFTPTFKAEALKNVVSYEENVRSALSKVALGEGDAAIVYTSDISGEAAHKVGRLDIPDSLNVLVSYPLAVTSDSPHPAQANTLLEYILSPAGQAILTQHGFISVTP